MRKILYRAKRAMPLQLSPINNPGVPAIVIILAAAYWFVVTEKFSDTKEGTLSSEYLVGILPERSVIVRDEDKILSPSERMAAVKI